MVESSSSSSDVKLKYRFKIHIFVQKIIILFLIIFSSPSFSSNWHDHFVDIFRHDDFKNSLGEPPYCIWAGILIKGSNNCHNTFKSQAEKDEVIKKLKKNRRKLLKKDCLLLKKF